METLEVPNETKTAAPKKIHRLQIGVNVMVQVALILLLAVMVNYLGFEHYRRWDVSRDKKFELSDKTKRFLESVKSKMRVTVFFGNRNPIAQDVQSLLTEYQYASKGKVDVENIDPERSLSRAKEIFEKYKVVTDESVVIVDYEGRSKTIKASEMADIEGGNSMFGEQPTVTAFKGEQAVTSAMIDLVEGHKNTVGYVLGHKEPTLTDAPPTMSPAMQAQPGEHSPVSILRTFIENENIKFSELNLFDVPSIPEEMKTIVIIGPQYDFSEREMQLLHTFWDKGGRILLLLDPAAKMPRLGGFLNTLGLRVNDDRLMAMVRTGIQEVALIRDVQARFLGDSPITKRLADARGLFLGGTSSITLEAERVRPANIRLQPLIQAEHGYWAEKDYNSTDQEKLQANAAAGQNATLTIAASIEKGGSADDRVQANSSRIVVVANATFVQDNALTQDQQGLDFVSGSINWLLNREQLIGIAPKVPKTLTFMLEDNAMRNLRWLILVLMPLVPALIGLAVWWQRRA
ncbi:MAG: GldG family protein [Verrucomicrobiota bacterium]|nr:GldG family protein [Verrucomicrobiota bacterium]